MRTWWTVRCGTAPCRNDVRCDHKYRWQLPLCQWVVLATHPSAPRTTSSARHGADAGWRIARGVNQTPSGTLPTMACCPAAPRTTSGAATRI